MVSLAWQTTRRSLREDPLESLTIVSFTLQLYSAKRSLTRGLHCQHRYPGTGHSMQILTFGMPIHRSSGCSDLRSAAALHFYLEEDSQVTAATMIPPIDQHICKVEVAIPRRARGTISLA